jgi:hypothetical protein
MHSADEVNDSIDESAVFNIYTGDFVGHRLSGKKRKVVVVINQITNKNIHHGNVIVLVM